MSPQTFFDGEDSQMARSVRQSRWVAGAALLATLFTSSLAWTAAGGDKSQGDVLKVEGEIAITDPNDTVRQKPHKVFPLKMEAGVTYVIDMKSKEIDSYLRLENSDKKQLAEDDDSGGNLDARITFRCTTAGEYRIIATTFGGGTGKFTLTVNAQKSVVSAMTLEKGAAEVKSELAKTDPKDRVRRNSPSKVYSVKLEGNKTYQIDMTSDKIDSYLRLEDADGKQLAEDDDSGGFPNARIIFACPKDGTYQIIATTFVGGEGPFNLRIEEKGAK
jgi:hypothetical protein